MKARKAITTTKRRQVTQDSRLHARVFRFDTTGADERYFKKWIHTWLLTPPSDKRPTWGQLLDKMVTIRNRDPKRLRYCYFNDRQQRVIITKDFETWATRTRDQQMALLQQYYA